MRLLRFAISERRGEPARELDFGREKGGEALVAITGPSGVGKTSILEAMAMHKEHIAPYHAQPGASDFLGTKDKALLEIESTWQLNENEVAESGSETDVLVAKSRFLDGVGTVDADPALTYYLGRFALDDWVPKVDLFPEARLGGTRGVAGGPPSLAQRMYRLAPDARKYAGLAKLLLETTDEKAAAVRSLLLEMCPGVGLRDDRLSFDTDYGERALSQLSLSQRLCFELAATFVLVGLRQSVVMIDGIERGLPPQTAIRAVEAVRRYAPEAQLIVTTNDHALLDRVGGKRIHLETP